MSYLKTREDTTLKFCIRDPFLAVMTHAKFCFNQLMATLIFGIWPSGLAND